MNCQIKKAIISLSVLGLGERLTVHVYASNEEEKYLVGRLDFVGKTQSNFKHSLNVICPDGFSLSATAVDQRGIPFNDSRGIKLTIAEDLYFPNGWHLNKSGEAHVAVEHDLLSASTYNMTAGVKTEPTRLQCAKISGKLRVNSDSETALKRAIDQALTDAIRNALKPGGLLWSGR